MVRVIHKRVISEQHALGTLCDNADARLVHAADSARYPEKLERLTGR